MMVNRAKKSRIGLAAGLVAIMAICASLTPAVSAEPVVEADTKTIMRVTNGELGKTLNVTIPEGKAFVLDLPVPVGDVLIANPKVMDAVVHTTTRLYLIGKLASQTNAILFDPEGRQLLTLEVSVTKRKFSGFEELEEIFKRLVPGSDIKLERVGYTVVLTGSVRTPADAARATSIAEGYFKEYNKYIDEASGEVSGTGNKSVSQAKIELLNLLAVEAKEQVMLKVQVVEMNRSVMKQLGINLGAIISSGSVYTSLLTDNALPLTAANGLGTLPTPAINSATGALSLWNSGPATGEFGNSGLVGSFGSSKNLGAYGLRAMERNGLVRTLAEPNLTAISGESAEFLAGGEIPYVKYIDPTTGQDSIAFKKYGVQLAFTPMVLSEGRISLKIDTAVSEIAEFVGGNPVFNKRQTRTTVELPSGGSMVLAGLISQETRQNIDGFPGLKNLPVLGTLFRSRDFVSKETELVVIVTPYVVNPVPTRELTRPDVGFAPASDAKANLLGHLNRVYGRRERLPKGGEHGDYGFIVE